SAAERNGSRTLCPARGGPATDAFETRLTVRFLADEDLEAGIVEALRSREPAIDVLDVKSSDLRGTKDPALLELAFQQNRIVITHDRRTMTRHLQERLAAGKTNPPLFIVPQRGSIGETIVAGSCMGCISDGGVA